MINKDTLRSSLKTVLEKSFTDSTLLLVRQDGIIVYEQDETISKSDKQALGALMAGSWQAANAMTNYLNEKSGKDFRLSFDTSDSGIYILPISAADETYFLGLFYKNEINPAILKNKLRNVSQEIIDELGIYFKARESINEPLFENITDDEMDKIFSFAGV